MSTNLEILMKDPTLILAKRDGSKLGVLNQVSDITYKRSLVNANELSFKVYKEGTPEEIWDSIIDFMLVWDNDHQEYFEITTQLSDGNGLVKDITGTSMCESELSQVNLYDVEINTEDDIARDDYVVATLYNPDNKDASILHRVLSKVPHYTILSVDDSIAGIMRQFSFDDKSIKDCLDEIAEEIGCMFEFTSRPLDDGKIGRYISARDLETKCNNCGYRGDFTGTCPECGSTDTDEGYGEPCGVYISTDNLASEITYECDTDSIKNCFHLEAGDDLMTATVKNCNPNGSNYIWYIDDDTRELMSDDLRIKLNEYDKKYSDYRSSTNITFTDATNAANYNALVNKYKSAYDRDDDDDGELDRELVQIDVKAKGFDNLVTVYYNALDFYYFLHDSMMPDYKLDDTDAETEAAKITTQKIIEDFYHVAVTNISSLSKESAENAVEGAIKCIVDSRYKITTTTNSYTSSSDTLKIWTGTFKLENYSDDNDYATTQNVVEVYIDDDYERYTKQRIKKVLAKNVDSSADITKLLGSDLDGDSTIDFPKEIKKYCYTSLTEFKNICQSIIDVLQTQGIANNELYEDLYTKIYIPYYTKLTQLDEESSLRATECEKVKVVYEDALKAKNRTNQTLDMETYLGSTLWTELCSFRREDSYQNDNYISDGLTNAEMVANAREFIKKAQNDLFKSATRQHTITASVANLLAMEEFQPFKDTFEVGNWIHLGVDGNVYKLRLSEYTLDYSSNDLNVTFTDIYENGSDIGALLGAMQSMSTSYEEVKTQAGNASDYYHVVSGWVNDGLDLTNMMITNNDDYQTQIIDEHGILCRAYDDITEEYDDNQVRIISNGLYMTDDNWKTVKVGVGEFYYYDPLNNEQKKGYGVIADKLISNVVLTEDLGVYSEGCYVNINDKGIVLNVDTTEDEDSRVGFTINKLYNSGGKVVSKSTFYVDANGEVHIDMGSDNLTIEGENTYQKIHTIDSTLGGTIDRVKVVEDEYTDQGDRLTTVEHTVKSLPDEWSSDISKISIGSSQLLRGTNIEDIINSSSTWSTGKWRITKASGSTNTVTAKAFTTSPPTTAITYYYEMTHNCGDSDGNRIGIMQRDVPVKAGATYTVSLWAKCISGTMPLTFFYNIYDSSGSATAKGTHTFTLSTSWKKYSYTFTADSDCGGYISPAFVTYKPSDQTVAYLVRICAMKLESGSYATDWGDDFSDMNSRISQTSDSIKLCVKETDVNGDYVIGKINLSSTTATIAAKYVNLEGAVTISSLSSDEGELKSWINDIDELSSAAKQLANTANGNASTAKTNSEDALNAAKNAVATANTASLNASSASDVAKQANNAISNWCYNSDTTYINGSSIWAGTISTQKLNLGGEMTVMSTDEGSDIGGFMGYVEGSDGSQTTHGMGFKDSTKKQFIGCTTSGAILNAGSGSSTVLCQSSQVKINHGTGTVIINSSGVPRLAYSSGQAGYVEVDSYPKMGLMTSTSHPVYVCLWDDATNKMATFCPNETAGTYNYNGVYLGTSAYRWKGLYTNAVNTSTAVTVSSDARLKHNIEYNSNDKYDMLFSKLKPCRFIYNEDEDSGYHTGFIAQDIKSAMDECDIDESEFAAYVDDEDRLAVRYEELISLCVNHIQRQDKRITELEEKIAELSTR